MDYLFIFLLAYLFTAYNIFWWELLEPYIAKRMAWVSSGHKIMGIIYSVLWGFFIFIELFSHGFQEKLFLEKIRLLMLFMSLIIFCVFLNSVFLLFIENIMAILIITVLILFFVSPIITGMILKRN